MYNAPQRLRVDTCTTKYTDCRLILNVSQWVWVDTCTTYPNDGRPGSVTSLGTIQIRYPDLFWQSSHYHPPQSKHTRCAAIACKVNPPPRCARWTSLAWAEQCTQPRDRVPHAGHAYIRALLFDVDVLPSACGNINMPDTPPFCCSAYPTRHREQACTMSQTVQVTTAPSLIVQHTHYCNALG